MTSWTHQRTEDEPAEGHLGCFQHWAIMNKAAINICVQGFAWTYIFDSLG